MIVDKEERLRYLRAIEGTLSEKKIDLENAYLLFINDLKELCEKHDIVIAVSEWFDLVTIESKDFNKEKQNFFHELDTFINVPELNELKKLEQIKKLEEDL